MITAPTISELYNSIKSNIEAEFGININPLLRVYLRAHCMVLAGKFWISYAILLKVQANLAPDKCDEETLARYADVKLNRTQRAATAGQYSATVTGQVGATIPGNTLYKSDDTALNPAVIYVLDEAFTLTTSPATISLRCLTAGLDGKLNVGDTLTATAPLPVISQTATVSAETIQPLAAETPAELRRAVILAYRTEPKGGAGTDYRLWSSDAAGVRTVYPYVKNGEGDSFVVYVEAVLINSVDGKGTPTNLTLQEVEEVIEFDPDTSLPTSERGRRPLGAAKHVEPITPLTVNITIPGYVGLDASKQTLITDGLREYLDTVRPYVASCDDITAKNDILDANKIGFSVISSVPGSVFGGPTFTVSGVPVSSYTFSLGDIPWLNTVTFT